MLAPFIKHFNTLNFFGYALIIIFAVIAGTLNFMFIQKKKLSLILNYKILGVTSFDDVTDEELIDFIEEYKEYTKNADDGLIHTKKKISDTSLFISTLLFTYALGNLFFNEFNSALLVSVIVWFAVLAFFIIQRLLSKSSPMYDTEEKSI